MNKRITAALELSSACAITIGATLWAAPAGLVVGGLFGLAFARGVGR